MLHPRRGYVLINDEYFQVFNKLNDTNSKPLNKIKLLLLALVVVALNLNAQTNDKKTFTNDALSLEARVFGLSQIWHFVKTDFAYYDKLPFNWDSTYTKKLTEVHSSNDRFQYYQSIRPNNYILSVSTSFLKFCG